MWYLIFSSKDISEWNALLVNVIQLKQLKMDFIYNNGKSMQSLQTCHTLLVNFINEFVADECLDADGNPISTGPFEKPDDCDNFLQVST